ncbi:hypothetical protein [Caballeronia sp. GAWG2-1]|uniref:hypothetical protein n=1 Tax=Caballeronia sp. GAWG2-1 TaxID=2921744 RepID=UPI002027DAD4|nr:hypothetical protein [Caballeronia sp. GAWG2-1]
MGSAQRVCEKQRGTSCASEAGSKAAFFGSFLCSSKERNPTAGEAATEQKRKATARLIRSAKKHQTAKEVPAQLKKAACLVIDYHEREQWEVPKGFVRNSGEPVVLQKPVPELLSLVPFFAAAKKGTPPPGRRLLNETARERQKNRKRTAKEPQTNVFKSCDS